MENGKRKMQIFFITIGSKKTDYTKQDHSFTSPRTPDCNKNAKKQKREENGMHASQSVFLLEMHQPKNKKQKLERTEQRSETPFVDPNVKTRQKTQKEMSEGVKKPKENQGVTYLI